MLSETADLVAEKVMHCMTSGGLFIGSYREMGNNKS